MFPSLPLPSPLLDHVTKCLQRLVTEWLTYVDARSFTVSAFMVEYAVDGVLGTHDFDLLHGIARCAVCVVPHILNSPSACVS